ncbi:MAG: S8 family serine peptidase [Solirubrobacterales bacterium]
MGVRWSLGALLAVACLAVPGVALAAFPGAPGESPRANTPNDPDFDRCESDDETTPDERECTSYFGEDFRLFGFSPDSAEQVPNPLGLLPRSLTATMYANCAQLDQPGRDANLAAGDPECAQIAGIRADSAWKYSTGDPETVVAILDTGIRWQDRELVDKVHLNADELPQPLADRATPLARDTPCSEFVAADDANGDGAFNVADFACDSRVALAAGDSESDDILDGSDLIATFSDGNDDDSNGYVDDIAGWDFFDDDNDPFDASSCCSANGHGTGRAKEAVAETDNGVGGPGVCPECQFMPLRIWDSFVVPTDANAAGVLYGVDNGASVAEIANGGLTNTRFAREVYRYADEQGMALMSVSSDINSANHNYPTNYDEAIYVAGSLPDTAPLETCSGPGGLPGLGDVLPVPGEFEDGCEELRGLLDEFLGIDLVAQPITTSFFRNANLTQYGGKADIGLMGATGSENTGQAAGAAALLASFGRETFGDGDPLSGNEIRQLLTMTAEDVLPKNTGVVGLPDKASPGWDPHFGYGRVNLAAAMERIADDRVPPEAQLYAPDWFAPINVDRLPRGGVAVHGRVAAPHGAGVGSWELEYACGQDAPDTEFAPVPGGSGAGPADGVLGTLSQSLLTGLAENCNGEVVNDAGRPAGTLDNPWPADPYPDPDPERHAFQIRLTVHELGDPANSGRYRKTLFAYSDDGNLPGWPRPLGSGADAGALQTASGGEVSPRLYDLDGDNELDILQPTSSGELHALHADGTPVESFNGGEPVSTDPYAIAAAHPPPASLPTPGETLRVPAIGDIDGDLEAEIVATGGEHVYVWSLEGVREQKIRLDPALSDPCVTGVPKPCFDAADRAITSENHIKRGFFGSPALADLDGDGVLDIVAAALDQHLYAFTGEGDDLPGFPVKLASEGAAGAEIVTSPAIADLDGDDDPEVIVATNEVVPGDPQFPTSLFELTSALLGSIAGSNPVYAVEGDGTPVDGWPVEVGVALGDVLPMVVPGHDAAVLDSDGDGDDEVSVTAATSLMPGGVRLVDGDGSTIVSYTNGVANTLDQGPVVNIADYQAVGDLAGLGDPSVVKGGTTLNFAANLLAPNQNLPFSHVEQAWDAQTGLALPGYPLATDDFQLLSQASIARVAGDGPGRQALVGTGLYNLHAYTATGGEAPGWPKFTGGWQQATPAVGDADGNGELEVTTLTREGWSFLWETGVDACDGSNDEWWTFHHDEHSTAAYGHDARPPGTASALSAERLTDGGAGFAWTAPGDDWLCGQADRYRLIVDDAPIDDPGDGTVAVEAGAAASAGETEQASLDAGELGGATHFGVLYRDEAGNWGLVRSAPIPAGGGDPGPGPGPGGPGGPAGGGGPGGAPGGGQGRCSNRVLGSRGPDRLVGTPGSDLIKGRGGRDRISGRAGDDCLSGGAGADVIRGGSGDDVLRGGRGRDLLRGGPGDDVIHAARGGRDRVVCGPGDDIAFANPSKDRVSRSCERVRRR